MNQKAMFVILFLSWQSAIAAPQPSVPPTSSLDRIALDINSERVLIEKGQTLDVVRGDLITIIDSWPQGGATKLALDFVGYAPARGKNDRDDRGFIINTTVDLRPQFAKNADKSVYEIQAKSGDVVMGSVFIHLIDPRLEQVEVSVNGKSQQLRDGDVLSLRASDKIAVRHVMTNIRGNENVRHELRTLNAPKGKPSRELIFARGEQVFGRIPLQWQE